MPEEINCDKAKSREKILVLVAKRCIMSYMLVCNISTRFVPPPSHPPAIAVVSVLFGGLPVSVHWLERRYCQCPYQKALNVVDLFRIISYWRGIVENDYSDWSQHDGDWNTLQKLKPNKDVSITRAKRCIYMSGLREMETLPWTSHTAELWHKIDIIGHWTTENWGVFIQGNCLFTICGPWGCEFWRFLWTSRIFVDLACCKSAYSFPNCPFGPALDYLMIRKLILHDPPDWTLFLSL